MWKTAEAGVTGALLRTFGHRFLLPITAVGMGMSGLGEVATASADSTGYLVALDRTMEVVAKSTDSDAWHKMKEASAGAASGLLTANLLSGRDCVADAETKAMELRSPLRIDVERSAGDVITDTLVDKIVGVESGGRKAAKNPNSSALGQGQFTRLTWLGMVRKHKPEWAEGLTTAQILEKRKVPEASRWAIKAYAEDNAPKLYRAGVAVDEASLYLAHMFDGPVAVKLYRAKPDAAVRDIVGMSAFKSNRKLLAGKKVKELISWAQNKMRGGRA
jgi:hypothetical protein